MSQTSSERAADRSDGPERRSDVALPPRRTALLTLVAVGLLLAAGYLLMSSTGPLAPSSPRATDAGVGSSSPAFDQFQRALGAAQILPASPSDLGVILTRLVLAAVLGGAISFRGTRRQFEIVHTNIIIAFSGAMMMIIVGSDLARAFGLVGASSIVRYRTPVRDPKALASLFVSMGAGIAVGVGLYELAIVATILVLLIELVLERGGLWLSHGWYRPERLYELSLETDTPDETLQAVRQILDQEHISHVLMDYDRGRKSENVKMGLEVGMPEGVDTEKLTLRILGAGARSANWRLSKEQ